MHWFGRRNKELEHNESSEVVSKNQILQLPPEKARQESKNKLDRPNIDRFQDKTPEEQSKMQKGQREFADEWKQSQKPNEGDSDTSDPDIGQRERAQCLEAKNENKPSKDETDPYKAFRNKYEVPKSQNIERNAPLNNKESEKGKIEGFER